jgi:TetR/AcrR family transcriptional regulator, transcriptional repressor for nem operon
VSEVSTYERLLDQAQRLVQMRGFNGFSYADLASQIGIRKPSIHYHFPAKQDLGLELIRRYRRQLRDGFAHADSISQDPAKRLSMYVQFFADLVRNGQLCLCTALAAEADSLSAAIHSELQAAFSDKTMWLEQNLAALGHSNADLKAKQMVATVEGAMLMARAYKDVMVYETICQQVLQGYQQ